MFRQTTKTMIAKFTKIAIRTLARPREITRSCPPTSITSSSRMTQRTYNGKSVTPSNSLSDNITFVGVFLWPLTLLPFFFPMPAYVDWLYDIAFPARVDVIHRAQHIISFYISKVQALRKTSFGPDKCQLVNYTACLLKFSTNTIEYC